MNACLQILAHTPELVKTINTIPINPNTSAADLQIAHAWKELCQLMLSTPNGHIIPSKFVKILHEAARDKNNDFFQSHEQNDVGEFFLFIIESLHRAYQQEIDVSIRGTVQNEQDVLAKACYQCILDNFKKEYSPIMELMYGVRGSALLPMMMSPSKARYQPEMFCMLELPVIYNNTPLTNLDECMSKYLTTEILQGDNAVTNEATGQKEVVQKRQWLWNCPKILTIVLLRYNGNQKHAHLIEFPKQCDFGKYVQGYRSKRYNYSLYGYCLHMGAMGYGHYTAIVHDQDSWVHYNDEFHGRIDGRNLPMENAYCLFYRRK